MGSIELALWRGYDPTLPYTQAPNFDPLAGEGVRHVSGRWNTVAPNRNLVCASEHPALALCELLAHDDGLENVVLIEFRIRTLGMESIDPSSVRHFLASGNVAATQRLGDGWYENGTFPLLKVPSALLPFTRNYLVKPRHPEVTLQLLRRESVAVDERLRCVKTS